MFAKYLTKYLFAHLWHDTIPSRRFIRDCWYYLFKFDNVLHVCTFLFDLSPNDIISLSFPTDVCSLQLAVDHILWPIWSNHQWTDHDPLLDFITHKIFVWGRLAWCIRHHDVHLLHQQPARSRWLTVSVKLQIKLFDLGWQHGPN